MNSLCYKGPSPPL